MKTWLFEGEVMWICFPSAALKRSQRTEEDKNKGRASKQTGEHNDT